MIAIATVPSVDAQLEVPLAGSVIVGKFPMEIDVKSENEPDATSNASSDKPGSHWFHDRS